MIEQRLRELDNEILDHEIQTLYGDCYLRLKRLLAREFVAGQYRKHFSPFRGATRSPEIVKEDLMALEESYELARRSKN